MYKVLPFFPFLMKMITFITNAFVVFRSIFYSTCYYLSPLLYCRALNSMYLSNILIIIFCNYHIIHSFIHPFIHSLIFVLLRIYQNSHFLIKLLQLRSINRLVCATGFLSNKESSTSPSSLVQSHKNF